jgi:NhaP-type Na+/H+ or K+/H+ antiporter
MIFEAIVFTIIGLSLSSFFHFKWSLGFSFGLFVDVLIFRFIGVFLIIFLSELIMRRKFGLSVKDLIFISYAGQIRGAVVLGLVLKLS